MKTRPLDSATLTRKQTPEGVPGRPGHSAKTAASRRRMARAMHLDGPPLKEDRDKRMDRSYEQK